jgi:putative endonuclease
MSAKRRRVGLAGEKAAREYLQGCGLRIEAVNYRCPLGEIDIVARGKKAVVFVEVRARTGGGFGTPAESITALKQNRLKRLAEHFMRCRYGREVPCRFDLIAVIMDPESLAVRDLRHYRGIIG